MTILKVTILGCGSSAGVPRADGSWGQCNPDNPKNMRSRCSILVDQFDEATPDKMTRVLIDTSPDLRTQLIKAKVQHLDAVLYTHDHADQTHGIDDLRALVIRNRKRIDAYLDESTARTLLPKFNYVFFTNEGSAYPALLKAIEIEGHGRQITINGEGGPITFTPYDQVHGEIKSLAYKFGNIGYCNDTNIIPQRTLNELHGLDLFIVDCLRYTPHPSHAHLEMSLAWISELNPKLSVLTNMHLDLDYDELSAKLPDNVVPAYDMISFEFKV